MKKTMKRLKTRFKGADGATLAEILSVLVIVGVLAVVAVAKGGVSIDSSVVAESEALKGQLRFAQNRSMNTADAWGISSTGSSYRLFRYSPDDGNTTYVDMPGIGDDTVNLSAKGCSASSFTISFDGWGRPCSGTTGTSAYGSNQTITVSKGGESRSITITKNTGFIE